MLVEEGESERGWGGEETRGAEADGGRAVR